MCRARARVCVWLHLQAPICIQIDRRTQVYEFFFHSTFLCIYVCLMKKSLRCNKDGVSNEWKREKKTEAENALNMAEQRNKLYIRENCMKFSSVICMQFRLLHCIHLPVIRREHPWAHFIVFTYSAATFFLALSFLFVVVSSSSSGDSSNNKDNDEGGTSKKTIAILFRSHCLMQNNGYVVVWVVN